MVHEELGRTLVKRKFATLKILTLRNDTILGFACESNPDVNDWFQTIDGVCEMVNSYVDEVCEHKFKIYFKIEINIVVLKKRKRKITIDHLDNYFYTYIKNCI